MEIAIDVAGRQAGRWTLNWMSSSWLQADVSTLEITIGEGTTDEVTWTSDVVAGIIEVTVIAGAVTVEEEDVVAVEMLDCDDEVGFEESTLFCVLPLNTKNPGFIKCFPVSVTFWHFINISSTLLPSLSP